jgi:TfoX/Sxy family transcriptional regulator of competence genes
VPYDEDLAHRIRELIAKEPNLTEQKMFGGLAFLINGNMAVAASGEGGLMVRVDPEESEKLTTGSAAEPMVMRGRPMPGWLRVPITELGTKPKLTKWVEVGTGYARSLPPKRK